MNKTKTSIKDAAASLVSALASKPRAIKPSPQAEKNLSERIQISKEVARELHSRKRELTAREKEVLVCFCSGHTVTSGAVEVGIAAKTFENHLNHAYNKLGVSNGRAAMTILYEQRIAELEEKLKVAEKASHRRTKR